MRVIFRVDASLQIGTGHVMRCLTLADALSIKGSECQFICRAHEGNLIEFIRSRGYIVHELPVIHEIATGSQASTLGKPINNMTYADWLGSSQTQDVEECVAILSAQQTDWLIVDHYALDSRWELALASYCRRLMVIDDLANRPHCCNLLLDQTFGREAQDYQSLVPTYCRLLCGSQYALLRPEFAALRSYSLERRAQPILRELLITMGGVDKDNATGQVLDALRCCPLPRDCRITVVMGGTAPWIDKIRKQAHEMPWPTRVLVDVSNMAKLMADSDLAIGSAGTTSWERCCLGMPTIMFLLAKNQLNIAEGLKHAGAGMLIGSFKSVQTKLTEALISIVDDPEILKSMSNSAAGIVDGNGVIGVLLSMEILSG